MGQLPDVPTTVARLLDLLPATLKSSSEDSYREYFVDAQEQVSQCFKACTGWANMGHQVLALPALDKGPTRTFSPTPPPSPVLAGKAANPRAPAGTALSDDFAMLVSPASDLHDFDMSFPSPSALAGETSTAALSPLAPMHAPIEPVVSPVFSPVPSDFGELDSFLFCQIGNVLWR